MKRSLLILINLLILFSSCTNRKSTNDISPIEPRPYPHTIDISASLQNSSDIRLSEIADSIKYIVISEERDVLISSFYNLIMTNNEFYILGESTYNRFDLTGKFINRIGQLGRGPEEYLSGSILVADPESDVLFVYRNYLHDIVTYNYSGEFMNKLPFKVSNEIGILESISDSKFVIFPVYSQVPEDMIVFGIFDQNGNEQFGLRHPALNLFSGLDNKRFMIGGPFNINTYFKNEIVFNCENDTVYKIGNDTIYPGFIINWGNLPRPKNFEEKYDIGGGGLKFASTFGRFLETSTNAFFILNNQVDFYLIDFNKYTGITKSMLVTNKDQKGFINDLDGGTNYFPKWTDRSGEIWIDAEDALTFKRNHSEELISKSTTSNPEMKANLKAFLDNLEIDDNPVLKLVYLKKDK